MQDNPYKATPENLNFTDSTSLPSTTELVKASEDLASIARWQAFFGFLGAFTCIMLMLAMFAQILFLAGTLSLGTGELFGLGIFLLVLLAYGLPTLKLLKASQSARLCARQAESFSKMIEAQRSFWSTIGMVVCITLGLYIVFFAVFLLLGVTGTFFF
jgi:hypothetical protein